MALAEGQTGHLADHQEAVYTVVHGATAGTSRPTLGSAGTQPTVVKWIGSVEPTNATNNDEWWDTTDDLVKLKVSGSFVASGNSAYAVADVAESLLTTDLSPGSATTFTAFHSGTFTAKSTVVVVHAGIGGASDGSFVRFRITVDGTSYSLGYSPRGDNFATARTKIITGLTVGTSYAWSLDYKAESATDFYCRPVTQPSEHASVVVERAAIP